MYQIARHESFANLLTHQQSVGFLFLFFFLGHISLLFRLFHIYPYFSFVTSSIAFILGKSSGKIF